MVRSGGCARLHLSVDMVLPPREEEPEEPELTVRCIRVVVLSSFARNPVSTIKIPRPLRGPCGDPAGPPYPEGTGVYITRNTMGLRTKAVRPFLSPDFTFYR